MPVDRRGRPPGRRVPFQRGALVTASVASDAAAMADVSSKSVFRVANGSPDVSASTSRRAQLRRPPFRCAMARLPLAAPGLPLAAPGLLGALELALQGHHGYEEHWSTKLNGAHLKSCRDLKTSRALSVELAQSTSQK